MLAPGTILIVYLQHACGMFRIACYRIARAMTFEALREKGLQNENLIYNGLICAVDIHRKAMKFSDSAVSRFKVMFSLLIIIGVICGSLNTFRIFQMASFGFDLEELSLRLIFLIIQLCYMFIGNYLAQEVIDHNNDVFVAVYNVRWYVAPLQIQKMILFLLQRGTKTFTLNIAGLFVGSLEGAATLLSTGISFFTVLYSTFAEFLISNFEGSFFFLIAVGVCCLSLNLFQLFQALAFGNNKEELLLHLLIVIIILLYMFLANLAGQEVMDHNNHVFFTIYNTRWYSAPLSIQKLILFLLQRGSKTFSLTIGGLFPTSLRGFASLASASISYFTVIYSTQQ
ncbi:PREDICTED: uncharacterized protein LOC105457851 [Wasmannia auropunctata]|uniref:uncharacterized protein LOC105457851 n=1 Tax=Wasmannia auropunctata TaxID=64793 RepID=UPI0005F04073|nr:PREDICTED: uncharacterized protein LOC105457851 [Wasmannia auropunctata]